MAHDKNGDGHLDKKELKEAFRVLGARIPCYRAGRAIYYSDIDMDGAINEDEIDHLVSYAIHYGYAFSQLHCYTTIYRLFSKLHFLQCKRLQEGCYLGWENLVLDNLTVTYSETWVALSI